MLSLAAAAAPGPLRLLARTLRFTIIDEVYLDELRARKQAFLFVTWHGRILMPILRHKDQQIVAMVSRSGDGDLAARVLAGLGYEAVRGSSSRGGNAAFHELNDRLRNGADGALIPDGPRGPAQQLKPGAIYLAQQSGVPILPLSATARPAYRFSSWDRLILPAPFSRVVIAYGAPVVVPPTLGADEVERVRAAVEQQLTTLDAKVDRCIEHFDERSTERPVAP